MSSPESSPLVVVHRQGSLRWGLDDEALAGGDVVEVCCAGGWLTGRFEWSGTVDVPPTFHFSIELGGGRIAEQTITLPEGALLRRTRSV